MRYFGFENFKDQILANLSQNANEIERFLETTKIGFFLVIDNLGVFKIGKN